MGCAWGIDGAPTVEVCKNICWAKRHLCYEALGDVEVAAEAVRKGRWIVCCFHLSSNQWSHFSQFWGNKTNKSKVYDYMPPEGPDDEKHTAGGHAVVITGL